ncbi:MAG: hypothetical protein ABRQ26_13200 [Syntrophomonadaceae bacterium]
MALITGGKITSIIIPECLSVVLNPAWPKIAAIVKRSQPLLLRCEANVWRRRCGFKLLGSPINVPTSNVRIDSFFLDEGFGSFDEYALDTHLE